MIRAPRSASCLVANGAATACSTAITVIPSSGSIHEKNSLCLCGSVACHHLNGSDRNVSQLCEDCPDMTQPTRATGAVVDFIASTSFSDIPSDALTIGRRCIADGLGVILAGSTTQASDILRAHVREDASRAESTMLGRDAFQTRAASAALVNGDERPRARLRRHAAVDGARSDLRPADASDDSAACPRRWPSASASASRAARCSRRSSLASRSSARLPRRSTRITTRRGSTRPARSAPSAPPARRRSCWTSIATGDRARARDRGEHSRRHPRELRHHDEAAACRPRGAERRHRRGARGARLHRRRRCARRAVGLLPGHFGGGFDAERIVGVLGNPHTIVEPRRVDQAVSVRRARPSDDGCDARRS